MATLYCAVRAPVERGGRGWLATGLLGGLTAVVNAPALVLVPILAIAARRRAALAPPRGGRRGRAGDAQELDRGRGARPHLVEHRDQPLPRQQSPVRRDGGDAPGPRLAGARPGAAAPRRVRRGGRRPASSWSASPRMPHASRRVPPRSRPGSSGCSLGGAEIPRNQEIYPARAWSPVLRVAALEGAGARVPVRPAPPAGRRRPRRGLAAGAGPRRLGRPARARRRRVLRHGALPRAAGPAAGAVRRGGRPVGGRRGERAGARRRPASSPWASISSPTWARGRCRVRMNRRRRAGPGPLARARGPPPGSPRALRAARARGPGLVRRLVRGRPAGERARPAGPRPRRRWRDPRARAGVPGHRPPPGARRRSRPGAGPRRRPSPAARWRSTPKRAGPGAPPARPRRSAPRRPGGPPGGCPDRVFVAAVRARPVERVGRLPDEPRPGQRATHSGRARGAALP